MLDIHAHLHTREFDADLKEVIARAKKAGVFKIINVGFDVEGNFRALALAKKYDFIFASFGVHPHLASEWNGDVSRKIFDTVKREPKIVALGEMGLDFYKNFQPKDIQTAVLEAQLRLAEELDLPAIIHCRDAFDDFFKIAAKTKNKKIILHCFTGSQEETKEAIRRGFYISFTGIITYKKADELRKIVSAVPKNRLFLETDCPFLAPQKYRGKRNEPAFVSEIYKKAAEIRRIELHELEEDIQKNAKELFGI